MIKFLACIISLAILAIMLLGKQKHLRCKKWCGQEKQWLKGMIWECGQDKIMHLRWKGKANQKQYKCNQQIYVGYYSWIAKSVHINLIEELHIQIKQLRG